MPFTPITAEEEYKKNPDIKKEDIQRLQEWLDRQPHLPKLKEVDLIVFYHSCNNSMELTKTTIDLNLTLRTHLKLYFVDRDPMEKKNLSAFDVVVFSALPERTKEGYQVYYNTLLDKDPSRFNLELAVKGFACFSDLVQYEKGTFPGVVMVIDLLGVVFGHIPKLTISTVKDVLFYLQEAMPVRLKSVHFMNAPSFMDRILSILKPFMKRELVEILHIHSANNPATLDRFIARHTLPKEAGGDYMSLEKIRAYTLVRLEDNRQFVIDEEKMRVQESRRPGKPKDLSQIYGVIGSFKKLEID